MKQVVIIFLDEAQEVYLYLAKKAPSSKIERSILNAVNQKLELIKKDYHYGRPIAKRLIPKEYRLKYDIDNLFRIELPNFWRMLYSLKEKENTIQVIAFILDVLDHKEYSKKLGYKK